MNARIAYFATAFVCSAGSFAVMSSAGPDSQPAASQETEAYKVDPVHSSAMFRIKHLGVSYLYGRINGPYGEFSFNSDNPEACAFDVKLSAEKVDTNNPRRDGHLKGADFFNAKQFPIIGFKSKQVTLSGDDTYRVTGDLTLHGVTRELTVELNHIGSGPDPWGGYRRGFETSFTIKRSDFGMKFMLDGVGDEVTLMVAFEGTRK